MFPTIVGLTLIPAAWETSRNKYALSNQRGLSTILPKLGPVVKQYCSLPPSTSITPTGRPRLSFVAELFSDIVK